MKPRNPTDLWKFVNYAHKHNFAYSTRSSVNSLDKHWKLKVLRKLEKA